MGRSGHHHSSHHHSHSRHYGSNETLPGGCYVAMIVLVLFLMFVSKTLEYNKISGHERLHTDVTITDYLYDEAEYFDDSREDEIIAGMRYFFVKTGVQPVIYTTYDYVSEESVTKKYYKMFDDGSHLLIALPINLFGNSDQYYYIGDDAERIISEYTVDAILDRVDNTFLSRNTAWRRAFEAVADMIVD